ncbi:MAG: terpene cyclase/mutase family protein [Planctomycetaceae bacterium]|nr:terpene cyclase/mutase family protein [Planctomycetaceae bacterium]
MSDRPEKKRPRDDDSPPEADHSERPTSKDGPSANRHELAAQARAAAEQAIKLARLAEESARIAQQLNAQAFEETGKSIPGIDAAALSHAAPSGEVSADFDEPAPLIGVTPPARTTGRESGRRQKSVRQRFEPARLGAAPVDEPKQVRIKSNPEDLERDDDPLREFARQWKSLIISTAVHVVVLLLLGFVTFAVSSDNPINTVMAAFADEEAVVEEELPIEEPVEDEGEQLEEPMPDEPEEPEPEEEPPPEQPPEQEQTEVAEEAPPTPGPEAAEQTTVDVSQVGSRSETGKAALLKKYGGTAASESAVQRTLDWFATVQRQDGSWNFNDVRQCSHAGDTDNPMGATAYVLLCYLGAGQTHQDGRFKKHVRAGLEFLIRNGKRVPAGGDFRGPDCREHDNFYVQAPVAMVLSEASMMTKDRRMGLREAAQSAVDFLCNAQNSTQGGWRYEPTVDGCTSVTVLVTMALMSAQKAGLKVPPQVLDGVGHFLDSVRTDGTPTGRYGYRAEEKGYRASSTSQALLARMYLGWNRENEELQKGIAIIDERGPYDNLYYCYYATQVMKHWGGEEWERWNSVMRDDLVKTQVSVEGPEFGSWTPRQSGGPDTAGGRLFITCLATMTLEVYYRYLPLYDSPITTEVVADAAPVEE